MVFGFEKGALDESRPTGVKLGSQLEEHARNLYIYITLYYIFLLHHHVKKLV